MKFRYVFLLGRAACGKSALYRQLEAQLLASGQAQSFERVDDFPKLWTKFTADDDREAEGLDRRWTARTEDGGYVLTDPNFLNDLLAKVNHDLLLIDKPDHTVLVEFARTSYVEAMRYFDRRILAESLVIYVKVCFETCWARVVAQHEANRDQDGDDHLVCRESMEEIFLHDDRDAFVDNMRAQGVPTIVIDNEPDGEDHLGRQVEMLVQHLF
jgi:hypothetical protein